MYKHSACLCVAYSVNLTDYNIENSRPTTQGPLVRLTIRSVRILAMRQHA